MKTINIQDYTVIKEGVEICVKRGDSRAPIDSLQSPKRTQLQSTKLQRRDTERAR
jgi:hypothetical protein